MNQWERMKEFVGKAGKKRLTIVNTGGHWAVNKNGGSMEVKGGAETINVAQIEIC